MATDEDVRDLLHRLTPRPAATVDVEDVRRRVRRRRTRATVVAAAVSVGLVVGGVGLVAATGGGDRPLPAERPSEPAPADPTSPGWHRLPDMPLSPRWSSLTVWTGEEFLVLGGIRQDHVGGPLPMPRLRDGAAYDPGSSSWRPVESAPESVWNQTESVLVGRTLVVVSNDGWWSYDVDEDEWRQLPAPAVRVPQPSLAATTGERDLVYALDVYESEAEGAPVQVLDVEEGSWSELPRSPHLPTLDGRTLVSTPEGLTVMGEDFHPRQAGRHQIEDAHAEIWTGTSWRRLGDSEVQGCCWHWTGHRIISAYRVTRFDSGRGSAYTFRAGALDPADGTWSRLPWLPRHSGRLVDGGRPVAEGPLVFSNGYLYDDETGQDEPVPKPDPRLQESSVALGDGRLVVFGGYRVAPGQETYHVMDVDPTADAWMYVTP